MTKEEFIKQAKVIEDYLAARRKAGDMLNETFFKGSTSSVFDFGNDLLDLAIEQLSELSGISMDSMGWLFYEGGGVCRYADGFEMDVKTSADLWDFEKYEPKDKHYENN